MQENTDILKAIFAAIMIFAALGMIFARKPVYASLCFLLTLLASSALFFELRAEIIGVLQLLVYGGATLVVFMFVIVLFQDAHHHIQEALPQSKPLLLSVACILFLGSLLLLGAGFIGFIPEEGELIEGFGQMQTLGKELYTNYFFPFEVVSLVFLVALVGALYVARKDAAHINVPRGRN
jgi:NADH-quinone oxidoreductase subunit J